MKKLIIFTIVLLIGLIGLTQTNVYIDPSQAVNGDGSIGSPYNTWASVDPLRSNYNYYQKMGTWEIYEGTINLSDINNVLITTYNTGERPIINSGEGDRVFDIMGCSDITIRGYSLINLNSDANEGLAGIAMGTWYTETLDDIVIDSCVINGFYYGIMSNCYGDGSGDIQDITIRRTTIFNTGTDNVFIKAQPKNYSDNVIIDSCYLYDANMYWYSNHNESISQGDNVHLVYCQHSEITNSILDRRSTSNKFCFIHSLSYGGTTLIRGNTFYPPKDSTHSCTNCGGAGGTLELANGLVKATIDHNLFSDRGTQRWGGMSASATGLTDTDTLLFNYNIMDSIGSFAMNPNNRQVLQAYNNTMISSSATNTYLFSYAGDITGNFKNNIVLVPVGITPVNGAGTGISQSNNITVASNPASWDATYSFFGSEDGQYQILSTSPLRNAGTTTYTGMTTDFAGIAVPQEALYDIGAYEYYSTVGSDPPGVIENIWYSNITDISVTANWSTVTTATGYEIYAATISELPIYVIDPLLDIGNVTSYDITGFLSNSNCIMGGNAYNANGDGPGMSSQFTTLCTAPEITDYIASDVTLIEGDAITFDPEFVSNSCNATKSTFLWQFEGATPETSTDSVPGILVELVYNNAGIYDVTLTITNNNGSDILTKLDYITVTAAVVTPVADFVANNLTPKVGQAVVFTDLSTNTPTSWLWAFSPVSVTYLSGTTSTSQHPVVRFNEYSTAYQVTLTATNSAGSDAEVKVAYITTLSTILKRWWVFIWR